MSKIQLIKLKEDNNMIKMKRIKIKKFTLTKLNIQTFYTSNAPLFAACYMSNKIKNEITSCGRFSSCRAYLTDTLRSIVLGKRLGSDGHSYYVEKHRSLKLSDIILGINYNTDIEHILNIVNILNCYSKVGNLPKFKLISMSEIKSSKLWFIKIPMKFKETPHLMSMVTLLIRVLFTVKNKDLEKLKNVGDIENYFHKHKKANGFDSVDSRHLYNNNNYLKLKTIIQRHKELFYGLGNKKLFPSSIGYDFHNTGGINSLCTAITHNKVLNNRAKTMLEIKEVKDEQIKKEEKIQAAEA